MERDKQLQELEVKSAWLNIFWVVMVLLFIILHYTVAPQSGATVLVVKTA